VKFVGEILKCENSVVLLYCWIFQFSLAQILRKFINLFFGIVMTELAQAVGTLLVRAPCRTIDNSAAKS